MNLLGKGAKQALDVSSVVTLTHGPILETDQGNLMRYEGFV